RRCGIHEDSGADGRPSCAVPMRTERRRASSLPPFAHSLSPRADPFRIVADVATAFDECADLIKSPHVFRLEPQIDRAQVLQAAFGFARAWNRNRADSHLCRSVKKP